MASAVPALGYTSRTEAALALRSQGLPTREIASRIGITAKQVSALEASARKRGARTADVAGGPRLAAVAELFPFHQKEALRAHAAKRDITANRLIQIIVDTVIDSDIVDAVLDDADDLRRWTS